MRDAIDRRSALGAVAAGILFVAVSVAGGILGSIDLPSPDATLADQSRYFADDGVGDRGDVIAVLTFASLPLFIWFLSWLRAALVSEDSDRLAGAVLASGIAYLTLHVAGVAVGGAVPSALGEFDAYQLDPSTGLTLVVVQWHLYTLAVASGAIMIGVASAAARRRGLLPRWLARTGEAAAAVAFITAFIGIGETFVLLWLLIVPAVIYRRTFGDRTAVGATAGTVPHPGPATS